MYGISQTTTTPACGSMSTMQKKKGRYTGARLRRRLYFLLPIALLFFVNIGSAFGWYYNSPVEFNSAVTEYYLRQKKLDTVGKKPRLIELKLDKKNTTSVVTETIARGGEHDGSHVYWVRNTGAAPGRLYVNLDAIRQFENGCNESEAAVDATCADPGEDLGEFEGVVLLKPVILRRSAEIELEPFYLDRKAGGKIARSWGSSRASIEPWISILQPQKELGLELRWEVDPQKLTTQMQSDSVEFVVEFTLEQLQ